MDRARVLVVDDKENILKLFERILGEAYQVTIAGDGARAIALVASQPFDVVVTDLRMPGGSGLDLLAWIKGYDPRIAVLAVTAYGSLETAIQAIRLGAADYIPKPFEPDALLLAVDKSLRERAKRVEVASNARVRCGLGDFSGAATRTLCPRRRLGHACELQVAVECAVNVCAGDVIVPEDFSPALQRLKEEDFFDRALERGVTLGALELAYARRVLARCGGNKKRAAAMLGIDRRTLHRWFGPAEGDDGE